MSSEIHLALERSGNESGGLHVETGINSGNDGCMDKLISSASPELRAF
jgi:hypothetical protein